MSARTPPAPPVKSRRPARSLLKRAGVALASGLVGMTLIELAARATLPPPSYNDRMLHDPVLGFREPPNDVQEQQDERGPFTVRLNAHGFRGAELPDPGEGPPPGTRRVLFIGDSFLAARRVRDEDHVASVARDRLAAAGHPVEVYSACCPGFGTAQELLLLREYGPRVRPDVVVLMMFPGNDVKNNWPEFQGADHFSYLRPYLSADGEDVTYMHPVRARLRNGLRSFAVLERRLIGLAAERGWDVGPRSAPPAPLVFVTPFARDSIWERAWQHTESLLSRFHEEVEALGAELLVLVVPTRFQVQRDASGHLEVIEGRVAPSDLDWNMPERRVASFLAREGIHGLLLLEPFRRAMTADPRAVYARDSHLTGRGHVIAGEEVAARVAALLEGAPLAPEPFVPSAPVDLLSEARCPVLFDVGANPSNECMVSGWGAWRRDWFRAGPGIALGLGGTGKLVLPDCGGDLVLRGTLPRRNAQLPWTLRVAFEGRAVEHTLAAAGPFEARIPAPPPPAAHPAAERIVELSVTRAGGEPVPGRLVVQQVGILGAP